MALGGPLEAIGMFEIPSILAAPNLVCGAKDIVHDPATRTALAVALVAIDEVRRRL
jgi:hypothetical protein